MSGTVQPPACIPHTAAPPGRGGQAPESAVINLALVNNMPDPALLDTERQYRRLAEAAATQTGLRVAVSLFCLEGVTRSEHVRRWMAGRYGRGEDLRRSAPDAVIMTGAEPRATALTDDPYWRPLTRALDWADANTGSVMLSCLAAHAAILHFDGVERRRLPRKCSGVFDIERTADHVLTSGVTPRWRAVHSRRNDAPEADLRARGYSILGRTDRAGAHLFVKQRGSLLVCFQGHPEYGTDTLLMEYRRDAGRFVRGEQDCYPDMPQDYFDPPSECRLRAFQAAAEARRTIETMTGFPKDLAIRSQASTWLPAAQCVFANWLADIHARRRARTVSDAGPVWSIIESNAISGR